MSTNPDETLSEESLRAFAAIGRSRTYYEALARHPSAAHGADADARQVAERHGLVHSDERLVSGARADLDFESRRIQADLPRRLALVEAYTEERRERERRHRRFELAQPTESGLADPGYFIGGPPRDGWKINAEGGKRAIQTDARSDREHRQPEVVGTDPDSREAEERALGGGGI